MIDEQDDDFVPVYEYLLGAGFSDAVAVSITLHAMIRQVCMTYQEIKSATEECGYGLPPSEAITLSFKDRN